MPITCGEVNCNQSIQWRTPNRKIVTQVTKTKQKAIPDIPYLNVVTDELWPSWQEQHLCSDFWVLTIDVQTAAVLSNPLTQASVQRAAAVLLCRHKNCAMKLGWDTQFYTQQCMGWSVVCRDICEIHFKYFLQETLFLLGTDRSEVSGLLVEGGAVRRCVLTLQLVVIKSTTKIQSGTQFNGNTPPLHHHSKWEIWSQQQLQLRLSCGGLRNCYLHSIANLFTPNTQPSKQHKLILFWEVRTFLSHFSQ